jgi:hypothetical protein
MAFIIKDRIKEGTTTTGTGDITLGGSPATFESFQSYMTNGDTTYYAIVHTASGVDEWEVGLGTWNTGNTLTRTTVLAGSSGTSAVNFSAGTKDIFMTYPAAHAALAGDDVTFDNITVTGTVDGRDVSADGTKLDTVEQNADVTDAVNVAAAGALMKSGGTMTGALILNADPTTALGAATKEYVDTIAAAGIHYHTPVRVESPSALTATYDNGTSGVGATLTNSGTQAALVIDGVTLSTSDRVLVYNQTNAAHNGIYTVTNTGSASSNWVLTRATDADSYGASDPNALGEGDAYFVKEGATGAGELYVMNTSGVITFGTTNITFTVIAETAVYSAGTGLTLTGTTFSIGQDVGTTDNVTFNQVTATIIGNVTGNVTGDVSGNAGTATKLATARTIQLSGDVTGSASFDGSANINITAAVQDDSHAHVISNVDGLQTALDGKVPTTRTLTAGNGLTGGGDLSANRTFNVGAGSGITVGADTVSHADTSTQASVNNSGRTYIQDITLDGFGHVTGLTSATETVTDTNQLTTFVVEDGDGTEVTISHGKEWKFVEGGGIDINWTDTSTGSDGDPYDLTIKHVDTSSQASVDNSNGTVIQDVTLDDYGHVTGLGSVDLDGRYVNVTGDTMTGALTVSTTGSGRNITLKDSDSSGTAATPWLQFKDSANTDLGYVGHGSSSSHDIFLYTNNGNPVIGGNSSSVAKFYKGGTYYNIFHDGYHPNADKWTTARTLTLSGDASGSVSWDGSANATLSVTVADDSHSHSNYITSNANDSMSGILTFTSTNNAFAEYNGSGTAPYLRFKTSGTNNGYIQFESNGNAYFWNDRANQGIKVETGTSGLKWYDGGAYRTVWHASNDGSGSGLDADLLDGYHLSTTSNAANTVPVRDANGYLNLGWINTTSGSTTSTINKIYASYDNYIRYITPATLISQLNLSTTSHNHTYDVNNVWLRDNGDNAHVKLYGNSRQMVFRTDGTTEYASGVGGYPFAWMYGGDASSNRRMLLSSVGDLWTSTNGWLSTALSGKLSTTGKAADSNLLDGIDSGSFVRSDADDTVSGHTEWQDSKEVRFGNDADFRIFHNGTHAYLRNYNHSQGNIYIQGENTSGTNQNLFVGVTNVARGYVSLYEDNTERLRTLSGGVGVTGLSVGDVDANPANSNGLTVANGGDEKIVLRNSSNPYISFQEATTTKAYMQWNSGGFLLFRHRESGSGRFTFRPNATTDSVDIRLEASDGDRYGSVYGTHNNEIGFLDQDGSWAYRHATDSLHEWRINNTVEMDLDSSGLDLKGNNLEGATDIYVADQIIHTGDTDTYMQFNAANTWRVVTGNTEGLKVSGVNVDLGIVGKIRHGGNTSTYMQFHNTDQWRVVVGNTERLEVKNSSPHVLVTGDLNSTSDERLKKNVTPITNALSDVIQLEGVSFDWKDTGTRGHGFIAQQVEPILPDVVQTDEETGIKSINYVGMIGHLVEAIKEQQEQIEELKRRIGE